MQSDVSLILILLVICVIYCHQVCTFHTEVDKSFIMSTGSVDKSYVYENVLVYERENIIFPHML